MMERRLEVATVGKLVGPVVVSLLLLAASPSLAEWEWDLPAGFPVPKVPKGNPMSIEKVELGRLLFYDTRLSGNQTQSCASCHQQEIAFTDGRETAVGSTGQVHPRNSMSLTNTAYSPTMTWANDLVTTFEDQALLPMFGEDPIVELGLVGKEEELFDRLAADSRYRRMFTEAFPEVADLITIQHIVQAIGAFERTLISGRSAYDRFVFDFDDDALSASAMRGRELFFSERLECFHCHGGFNFSAALTHSGSPFVEKAFFNTGLYNIDGEGSYPPQNRGLFEISQDPEDMGRFKPPTLRNIELTAPYMHDGSIATLEEAIDHYAAGGRTIEEGPRAGVGSENPYKSTFVSGFTIDEQEKQDVVAFLKSLTDWEFVSDPTIADPFAASPCMADCNLDGQVEVSELVTDVRVALGEESLARCLAGDPDGDGEVAVTELVGAVQRALGGCPTE